MRWYATPSLFQSDWFAELTPKQKTLWIYINCHCNAAGIWTPSFKTASMLIGERVMERDLAAFGARVKTLPSGNILIKGFIREQFGEITSKHGIHRNILNIISAEGLEINELLQIPTERDLDTSPLPIRSPREGEGEGETLVPLEKESEEKPLLEVVETWNKTAGLDSIRKLTDKRKTFLKLRLKDSFFLENWRSAISEIPGRPFLMGKNDRGWKADFDWFLKPDSVLKIMEGNYRNGSSNGYVKKINPVNGMEYVTRSDNS